MGMGIILYLVIIVLVIAAQWKVYEKAGEPGWACIVPIYNIIVLLKIVGKPAWWILLLLVPIANIVVLIWTTNLLAIKFGKGTGFTIGLILLPIVFWPMLGFGDAQYQGNEGGLATDETVLDA